MKKKTKNESTTSGSAVGLSELLCPDCGEEMKYQNSPTRHVLFKIPFTEIYLELWNWGHRELFCLDCALEKDREIQRSIYDAGASDGYEKGYRAASKA